MRALEVFKAISAGDLLFLRILPEGVTGVGGGGSPIALAWA